MPPKKKKAAAPKKEEAVPALSEEERLVLAQAEALKVRGGRGRERLFSFRLPLDPKRSTRRLPPSPRASPRAILADALRSLRVPSVTPSADARTRANPPVRVCASQAEEAQIAANEARLVDLRRRRDEERRRSTRNEKLITARWLVIMRSAKSKELREAATIMAQTHSRVMDRKNALLRSLEREVDDAETQRRRSAASHATRAAETSDWFATDARAIADAFENEESEIKEKHARHRRDMLDVLDAMEKAHESSFVTRRARFETAREEIKSRNAEAFENAKNRLEATVRLCEKACEEAHRAYVTGTDTRAASFERLTEQDSRSAKTIESRMRELARLARRVRSLKGVLESQNREWRLKNKALRKEKELIRDHGLRLAAETKKFRLEAEKKLKQLLVGSNGASKALDAKLLEAEKILKLAAAARRLETERERVVPFGEEDDDVFQEEEEAEGSVPKTELEERIGATTFSTLLNLPEEERLSTGALDARGRSVDETRYLERFFKRLNKAYLDERALSNERERLRSENDDLRALVAGYLDGVTVTDDSVRDPNNPLFVVNERALKAAAARRDAEAREAARAGEGDEKRKLYNSKKRGDERSEREREREERAAAPPVEVFVNAN
jgi:hypothetical protein